MSDSNDDVNTTETENPEVSKPEIQVEVLDPTSDASPEAKQVEKTKKSPGRPKKSETTAVDLTEQKKIEDAVRFINEKGNKMLYRGSVEIGEYLYEKFFDRDRSKVESRKPDKPSSFRKLCTHPDLLLDYSTLNKMVRVAIQEEFFKEQGITSNKLLYTHRATLLRLPDGEDKKELASLALNEDMTTRQFSAKVDERMKQLGLGRSRMVFPTLEDPVTQLNSILGDLAPNQVNSDREYLKDLDAPVRDDLQAKAEAALASLITIEKTYRTLLANLKAVRKKGTSESQVEG